LIRLLQDDNKSVNICKRSHAYLQSLALGLSIVSEGWLFQSAKTKCWERIDEYEIYSDELTFKSRQFFAATGVCRRSRLLYKSETVPFFGYVFFIPQSGQEEQYIVHRLTTNLVEIWGGTIIWTKEEFEATIRTGKKLVCLVASSSMLYISLYVTYMPPGYKVVENLNRMGDSEVSEVIDYSWVEDSVAACRRLPPEDYTRGQIVKTDD